VSTPAAHALGIQLPFWQAVARRVTWQNIMVAQAFGQVETVSSYLGFPGSGVPPHALQTSVIIDSVAALLILIAAIATDEAVRRGARLSRAYPIALLAASLCAAVAQWHVRLWLGIVDFLPDSGPVVSRIFGAAIDVATVGGLAMMVYIQHQSSQRLLHGIRLAELERVQGERRLIEARLAATYAQVDTGSALQTLAAIRNQYATARPEAESTLDAFIQDLRASVVRSEVAATSRATVIP
jgi:hypothetical protein